MGIGLLAVLAAQAAWRDLLTIGWFDEESSQVLLAPFAAAWLAWMRREQLKSTPLKPSWLGPLLLLLAAGLYVLGDVMLWQVFWHLSAVLALIGAFVSVLGHRILWQAWPAALVLLFMAPVPGRVRQAISLPLQEWTAIGGQYIFQLLGVYVERAGNVLVINDAPIEVEEACNGLRLIFALTLVCYVYAFSVPMKNWARALLLLASPLLAVLLNTLRLVPTAWMYAYATSERAQLFHDVSGWLMLPLALGCLVAIGRVVGWVRGRGDMPPGSDAPAEERPTVTRPRASFNEIEARVTGLRYWAPALLAAPLIGLMPLADRSVQPDWPPANDYHATLRHLAQDLPYRIEGWVGSDSEPPPAVGELLKPNVMVSRTYRHLDTGQLTSVLLVQSRDARDLAGHYPPICYPAHGWESRGETALTWTWDEHTVPITRYSFFRDQLNTVPAIAVYDLFALPGEGLTPDMTSLRRRGERRHIRAYGAAHWMVVFPADMPAEDQVSAAKTLTQAFMPFLEAVVQVSAASEPEGEPR